MSAEGASPFLELIRAADASGDYAALMQAIPYAAFLGLEIEIGEAGLVVLLPFATHIVGNPTLPAIHGGVTGALLEQTAIMTVMADMDSLRLPKTITITIDYLRTGRAEPTRAAARITRLGRRVANVRVEAWQSDRAKPIATANVHFLLA